VNWYTASYGLFEVGFFSKPTDLRLPIPIYVFKTEPKISIFLCCTLEIKLGKMFKIRAFIRSSNNETSLKTIVSNHFWNIKVKNLVRKLEFLNF